jgi:hypothetical protein
MDIGQPEGEANQNSVIGVLIGREWEMVLEWQHVSGSAHTCVTSRKGNPGALRLGIELELDLVLRRPSVLDGEPLWDSALPPFCHLSCVEIITVIVSLNFNPLHS